MISAHIMLLPKITRLNHRLAEIARDIHTVQQAAYLVEVTLLGVQDFPPLEVNPHDIQQSGDHYQGALIHGQLVGVISHEPVGEEGDRNITSLVVFPQWHRQGIAKALLVKILSEFPDSVITVTTAVKNEPAISLYSKFGFAEYARGVKGAESIHVISFRRERSIPSVQLVR
jgi:ribosomal protein S18 acetylase RimI-like enzyme